jgi:hypothetical protein
MNDATETTFDLDDYRNAEDLREIWDTLSSPVLFVFDEHGVNVAEARLRHLHGKTWIYVDETDGFDLVDESDVEDLYLATEDTGYGYQPDGSVVNAEGEVVYSPED